MRIPARLLVCLRGAAFAALFSARLGDSAVGQQLVGLEWETIAPLPLPVRAPAAAAGPDRIYVVGGTSPEGRTGVVQILDIASGTWSIGSSIPEATEWGAAVWFDDRLHVLGGVTAQLAASPQHWMYDPGADSWTPSASLPAPAAGAAATAIGSHIFVLGGIDGPRAHSANVMIFDGARENWSFGEALPGPRINWSGGVVAGRVLAAGGGTPGLDTTGELLSYDPQRDSWTRLAPLAVPREAHGTAAAGRWLCVAGGRRAAAGNFNTPFADAACYDVAVGTWYPLPELPEPRQELVMVAVDDVLYVLGGRDHEGSPMADAVRLQLRVRSVVSAF